MVSLAADPLVVTGPARPVRPFRVGVMGGFVLLAIALPCFLTLPWSISRYDVQDYGGEFASARRAPSLAEPFGTDGLGRSLLWRCLLGGVVSLGIGLSAATVSVFIGVTWGMVSGYLGGRTDAFMMRIVDVLYGLPYVLLVVLVNIAMKPPLEVFTSWFLAPAHAPAAAEVLTLLVAIGAVSWLTLARVIRGQVLSLREQPFIEAARACGVGHGRIFVWHLLPNLIGPIVVYTTLTVPVAVLQESFLSFLGIGVQQPLPSWGNLAAEGVSELGSIGMFGTRTYWWLLLWPCVLLGLTLMALNFIGDALRDRLDPKRIK